MTNPSPQSLREIIDKMQHRIGEAWEACEACEEIELDNIDEAFEKYGDEVDAAEAEALEAISKAVLECVPEKKVSLRKSHLLPDSKSEDWYSGYNQAIDQILANLKRKGIE